MEFIPGRESALERYVVVVRVYRSVGDLWTGVWILQGSKLEAKKQEGTLTLSVFERKLLIVEEFCDYASGIQIIDHIR